VLPVVLLIGVALVLRLGALLVHRDLSFDDSVYGASIVAMRHGLVPYRDLFASQGPLQFPLLFAGDVIGLGAQNGPRVIPVLAGIVTPIVVWATGRRLGAMPGVALVAGLLVAATGSMLWTTGPATADGPAAAFTAGAIYVAVGYEIRPTSWAPLLAGGFLGAALATKPLMFPAVLPVMIWMSRRSRGACLTTGAAALCVWLASALPFGLSHVWDQSIVFHLDKAGPIAPIANLGLVVRTLFDRDLLLVVAVLLGVATAFTRHGLQLVSRWTALLLGTWLALVIVVLLFERLVLVNHVATLVLPLALLFTARPPPLRWIAVAAAVLIPVQAIQLSAIVLPTGYHGRTEQVIDTLQSLPPRAQVASDVPGLVWQAGRTTPRFLNDPSNARIETHRLTTATVIAAARAPSTCAVVIWSFRFGNDLPGLRDALRQQRYTLSQNYAPNEQLWNKTNCHP
jgi:hypothetical protein